MFGRKKFNNMPNQQAKKYKCIFFDLDHTLWDYETNAKETLYELYDDYQLQSKGVTDPLSLYNQFRKVNVELWDQYDRQLINHDYIRIERFKQILEHFGAYEEKLSTDISVDYLKQCPEKGNLMPFATEVLEYLSGKYQLTVITNGFEEIQNIKLTSGNLQRFFDHVVTSQRAGHRKPSQKIFEYAMELNGVTASEALMVGDNLVTDIGGARGVKIDSVFFNYDKIAHNGEPDREITCLSELRHFL
jgi:YjjG family noncanonical pyrimidine nucleotidase